MRSEKQSLSAVLKFMDSGCDRGIRKLYSVAALAGMLLVTGFTTQCSDKETPRPVVDPEHNLVLMNVTIVDSHDGHLSPDMTISITAGKITGISQHYVPRPQMHAAVVDAQGKFLVPGFVDGHAHIIDDPDATNEEALMLANGITGFRQMSGSPDLLRQRREGKLFQSTFTPKLLAMPGRLLLPTNAFSPDQAIAEVDRQKSEGADFIKGILMPPSAFFAAAAEARKVRLPFEGHLPPGVDPIQAVHAGYRSIEHLGPGSGMLIDCSTDEAALKQEIADRPLKKVPPVPQFVVDWFVRKMVRQTLLAEISFDPETIQRMQRIVETFDERKCQSLVAAIAKSGSWQVPTLIKLQSGEFGDNPEYLNAPDWQYVAPSVHKAVIASGRDFASKITPAQRLTIQKFWQLQLKLARMLDDAGVPMLAGSDSSGGAAGFNLHKEFKLLAQDGFSPLKVLQMTTLNAAKFYGREATMGSVEVGKDADLVLLDANPIDSVQHLDLIDAVVRNGQLYSREVLDAKLREVAQQESRR